jgi:hypothetical protein
MNKGFSKYKDQTFNAMRQGAFDPIGWKVEATLNYAIGNVTSVGVLARGD